MKQLFFFVLMLLSASLSQAQWESEVRLTNDPGVSLTPINNERSVAVNGDTVHVVWYDDRDGNQEIYYKRSTDGGSTWEPDVRLTNNPDFSTMPSVAVSGSKVLVMWGDGRDGNYEIYCKRSMDGGTSWESDTRLTFASGNSYRPSVAISGSVVHVVWHDDRDGMFAIYYKRSENGGSSWEDETRLTTNSTYAVSAAIAVSCSVLHISWLDNRDGHSEIYYTNSMDGGINWGANTRLTNNLAVKNRPCISVSGLVVHVVWSDYRDGDSEIYYNLSADGGVSWGTNTRLTNYPGDSYAPSIAVSGNAVHVVWYDDRDIYREIYYKRCDDEGIKWGADTQLTYASGDPQDPSIAVSGTVVHIVWTDARDGNFEIYYKRDATGGFATGTNDLAISNSGQEMILRPNPASTRINIHINGFSNDQTFLTIRNILGKELLSRQLQGNETDVDISNLQNGLYFVSMTNDNKQSVGKKLVILK